MVKDQSTILQLDWEIVEVLPAWKFRVKLKDTDLIIVCYKAGKMKQSHISVIEWDRVKIDVNQYDMTQWRIVYRYNEYKK
jgi:translation initiation factor IF-1